MRKIKKISILTIGLAMALFFTGCTNGELGVYKAFLKSQDITSMESKTNVSFALEGEGLSEENQAMLAEASKFLNDYKISMNQKMEQNEARTVAKVQADGEVEMGGIKADLSVWVNVDASKDVPEMEYVIKMPKMIMGTLGEEFANKEYIVYDYAEMLEMSGADIDYTELMNWSKEMQPKMTAFFADYVKNFNSDIKMVEYKGQKVVDSKVLQIYELKLNDESFKKLMRESVNNFVENEDMNKFMVEYIDMMISMVEGQDGEDKEKISKEIEELKKEIPNIKEGFNKFMDEFDKIKVLGEEGIIIEYGVNKEGYIASEKGSINLILDLETLGNKVNELNNEKVKAPEMKGMVKLKINFDTNNYNINEGVKVEMPELTDKNSLKISDIPKLLK